MKTLNTIKTGRFLALFLLLVQACSFGFDGDGTDMRLGRFGQVRFTGGGGCTDSTAMAMGSTTTLTVEPAHGQILPADLTPRSTTPATIGAMAGPDPYQIELTALKQGEADIEVTTGGEVYDVLGFSVEPAESVAIVAPAEVFSGGSLLLKVNEVYGACGEDCKLIGGGFLQWSAEPADALTLAVHEDRVAIMAAGAAGEARVLGREPTTGAVLVDHSVSVVPTDGAGELETTVTVMLPDETVLDPQSMPVEVTVGSLFMIEITSRDALGRSVELAGRDVSWSIEGDTAAVADWPENEPAAPEGPIYEALSAGTVTLVADAALLGKTGRYQVTIVD